MRFKPNVPIVLSLLFAVATFAACAPGNPLLETEWDTPFGVPPFDRIENEHYREAFRAAMAEHAAEIDAIVNNEAEPNFENTIEAFERSGKKLGRVARVFGAVNGAHTNDTLQEIARQLAPERAAHSDDIRLNADLYARVKAVYDERENLDLNPEQLRLLEETHKDFVRSGVNLQGEAQVRLREINAELAQLSQQFSQNLLAETNGFELHVSDTADLGALMPAQVQAAAEEAGRRGHDSGWSFTLQRPSINPFLQYSPNRDLRRRVFMGYAMRGDNDNERDNKHILSRMAALRAERAALMDYETHAHFVLSDNMAETPDRVYDFLDQIWAPALRVARAERRALQSMMRQDGISSDLEAWDWRYYAEKLRKAQYDIDEEAVRAYFEVNAVRDGAFDIANKLWGMTFTELPDLPRWHPDQQAFEVKEADGTHIGILYMDFFTRPSKRGGAWANSLRSQSRIDGEITPIVTTNFNFPAPTASMPSLISFDNASTLLHEFGHALHGLLSDVTYESLSGTSVPRDFVEFPSQMMEHWLGEPEVLRSFAKHYETGEAIPDELIQKLNDAAQFNQGFASIEYLAASYLDMAWHTLTEPVEHDAREFENAEMARLGLVDEIIPRYRSTYFSHIFAGGYSSGYYSYIWAEVLDSDAYKAFKETSLFDQDVARRYREHILSKGGTQPGMDLYVAFRGRQPTIEALLENRGLIGR